MTQSTRRTALKSITGMVASASAPAFYMKNASAQTFRNDPGDSKTVTIGLTLPLTGAYADEGKDELRAYELAKKEGADKLAAWKAAPDNAAMPAPVEFSRDQAQNVPPAMLKAVLRAETKALPHFVGVDYFYF